MVAPYCCYLAVQPWTDAFRTWLQGHRAFIERLPIWTLRLAFPRPLDRAYDDYQRVIRDELETPLQAATIAELRASFERLPKTAPVSPGTVSGPAARTIGPFNTARFAALYRRWLKRGDSVLESLASPVLRDALARGSGAVECVVLPHTYRHLAPVCRPASRITGSVEKGDQGGDNPSTRAQPQALTPSQRLESLRQESERAWNRLVGRA